MQRKEIQQHGILFYLKFSFHLLTCSVFSSTSGRVLEARTWSGGRRYIQVVYTAPQSDKAVKSNIEKA